MESNMNLKLINSYNKIYKCLDNIKRGETDHYTTDPKIEKHKITGNLTSLLDELKSNLNNCLGSSYSVNDVILTKNLDHPFFGMKVYCERLSPDDVLYCIGLKDKNNNTDNRSINIELDSKLFTDLGLTTIEILSLLLAHVYRISNTSKLLAEVRRAVVDYMSRYNIILKAPKNIFYNKYYRILAFGIKEAMDRMSSPFYLDNDHPSMIELSSVKVTPGLQLSFENVGTVTNLQDYYNTAQNRIGLGGLQFSHKDYTSNLMLLSWLLLVYRDVFHLRDRCKGTLIESAKLIGSKLYQSEVQVLCRVLDNIVSDEIAVMNEGFCDWFANEQSTLNFYDKEYYELELRGSVKDIEKNEAIDILQMINSYLTVLEDIFSNTEKKEIKRQSYALMQRYAKLRNKLVKETSYHNTGNKLYITYPKGYTD